MGQYSLIAYTSVSDIYVANKNVKFHEIVPPERFKERRSSVGLYALPYKDGRFGNIEVDDNPQTLEYNPTVSLFFKERNATNYNVQRILSGCIDNGQKISSDTESWYVNPYEENVPEIFNKNVEQYRTFDFKRLFSTIHRDILNEFHVEPVIEVSNRTFLTEEIIRNESHVIHTTLWSWINKFTARNRKFFNELVGYMRNYPMARYSVLSIPETELLVEKNVNFASRKSFSDKYNTYSPFLRVIGYKNFCEEYDPSRYFNYTLNFTLYELE